MISLLCLLAGIILTAGTLASVSYATMHADLVGPAGIALGVSIDVVLLGTGGIGWAIYKWCNPPRSLV